MNKPLLSICIATHNRAGYIGETLDSIIPQLDDDVELLVVDGASTDNTEDVVRKFAQKESRIRYIRLSAKGGVDQDYDKSVELAHGEFCWLFTDDDLLRPGAVAAVKAAIKEGHDLVVVNAEVRDRELSTILERQRIIMQDNKVYAPNDMECLFIEALNYLSFIGAVVIRRSTWLSRERAAYFGTEFVHIGVIFQKPLPESALIIAEPYISIRFGNAQWTPRGFDIWMFKWPKLVWSFNHISKEAKLSVYSREPWRNFRTLIVQRSLGGYNIQSYCQYFSAMRVDVLWKFCVWLIACFPRKVIVGFHYLYSRIKGPESRAFFDNHFAKQRGGNIQCI
ncbi:glycosyltransferase family 2 protein [Patescibacteria group bacterium]|nr:glycosyltransferase family 2 protein [Patescibacteria group bacterium]